MTYAQFQIYNQQQHSKEDIKAKFLNHIKKEGWLPTTKKEAQISYKLAFSEISKWISIVCDDLNFPTLESDAKKLAEALGTYVTLTVVIDSDNLLLWLYNKEGVQQDRVGVGIEVGEMFPNGNIEGNPDAWKPLIVEGKSPQQLREAWDNQDYVFVEEVLAQTVEILGMDKKNAHSDWHVFELEEEKPPTFDLYFKKKSDTKEAPKYFTDELPTKLKLYSSYSEIISNEPTTATFYNVGGISKGLLIIFDGQCFENDAVTIPEIVITKGIQPVMPTADEASEKTIVSTEKRKFPDGKWRILAKLDNFTFSEGINEESYNPHSMKQLTALTQAIFKHCVSIQFTGCIQKGEAHEIVIHIAPKENFTEGANSRSMKLLKKN